MSEGLLCFFFGLMLALMAQHMRLWAFASRDHCFSASLLLQREPCGVSLWYITDQREHLLWCTGWHASFMKELKLWHHQQVMMSYQGTPAYCAVLHGIMHVLQHLGLGRVDIGLHGGCVTWPLGASGTICDAVKQSCSKL